MIVCLSGMIGRVWVVKIPRCRPLASDSVKTALLLVHSCDCYVVTTK